MRPASAAMWSYAGGTALSLVACGLALHAQATGRAASFGSLDMTLVSQVLMGATLLFGLAFVVPALRQGQEERDQLTNRAAKLEVEAFTDALTGLYNRRYFEDALREYIAAFSQAGAPLGLLTLDLDHFKAVNDNYGHDAGDIVLKELAKLLQGLTREHDIVARTGGEEFVVLAPFSGIEQVRPFAERLCRMVANMRVDLGRIVLRPTVSIGLATTFETIDPKALVKMSDERLYTAKQTGRNRVCAGVLETA